MPARPIRAHSIMAAVISEGPTSAQFTAAFCVKKATTFPDLSYARHTVAVTGAGGSNSEESHAVALGDGISWDTGA